MGGMVVLDWRGLLWGINFWAIQGYMATSEKLRIDKYLWAIRIFKTRTLATAACDDGKVKLDGQNVKPAKPVSVGDRYDIKTPARRWTIEVTGLLHNRGGYEEAIKNYVDLTSEEDKQPAQYLDSSFYTGKRLSKTGRPSKKQRRDLGDVLGSDDVE
jgi:ribosome-associated heat shock protein Hsp15